MNLRKLGIGAIVVIGLLLIFIPQARDVMNLSGVEVNLLSKTATSGAMMVSSDVQVLATSTGRAYARICNDSASKIYLGLNKDIGVDVNSQPLAANTCYEIGPDNLYTGAVRASSTVSSSVNVIDLY